MATLPSRRLVCNACRLALRHPTSLQGRSPSRCLTNTSQRPGQATITTTNDTSHDESIRPPPEEKPDLSIAHYSTTTPPTAAQLRHARTVFTTRAPSFLHGSAHFRNLPRSACPEVIFLGRSNVGKSSLLNALFGRAKNEVAWTSKRPGRTREMNAFGVGGGVALVRGRSEVLAAAGDRVASPRELELAHDRWVPSDARGRRDAGPLVVLDMPGYGRASREAWGEEITKYLTRRAQLRRAFVLVHAAHGLKPTDYLVLRLLRESSVPHQIVLTKVDELVGGRAPGIVDSAWLAKARRKLQARIDEIYAEAVQPAGWRGMAALGDVLATSATVKADGRAGVPPDFLGVGAVRWAVLQAAGLDCEPDGRRKSVEWAVQAEEEPESPLEEGAEHRHGRVRAAA